MSLVDTLRPEAASAPPSGIVEVANYGRTRQGVLPLWVGEGDEPTPPFIVEAATRSLAAGETYYTWQRGLPDLRDALARYHERLYGRSFERENFYVTGSGMQALQIAIAMTLGPGDECLIPSPAWPNAAAAMGIRDASPIFVPMSLGNDGWRLDLERLFAAATPRTRALFVNTPGNPTGWTARREELAAIIAFARQKGLWIIADEIYARFCYDGERAPSFHDVMAPADKILFVNTFSKNWAMTGWRIGWIGAHSSLGPTIENMIQYSTSGVPVFLQRGAIAALDKGEGYIDYTIRRAREGRDIICRALAGSGRARFAPPKGAFYLFFSIEGATDVRQLALRLIDETGIGLAPGTAFGPGGENFMRLCFLRGAQDLERTAEKLAGWLRALR